MGLINIICTLIYISLLGHSGMVSSHTRLVDSLMRRLCHANGLHNPPPPGRFVITTVPPQLGITVVPPSRVHIPIMRPPARLAPLHIHIPLDDRRDAAGLANIAAHRKRRGGAPAADIARFRPVARAGWSRTAARPPAAGEEDAEERAQGRSRRGDDTDADLDCRPDRNVHGGVEEVADVGHAANEWDADDRGA